MKLDRKLAIGATAAVVLAALGAGVALNSPQLFQPRPSEAQKAAFKATPLSIEEALARKKALFVDVRGPDSFSYAHVKGAVSLYDRMILTDRDPQLPRDQDLVLYCACPHEESAIAAAHQLYGRYGYERLYVMKGGIQGWQDKKLPIEQGGAAK